MISLSNWMRKVLSCHGSWTTSMKKWMMTKDGTSWDRSRTLERISSKMPIKNIPMICSPSCLQKVLSSRTIQKSSVLSGRKQRRISKNMPIISLKKWIVTVSLLLTSTEEKKASGAILPNLKGGNSPMSQN